MLLLDGILSIWLNIHVPAPFVEHNLHFEFRFIIDEVGWKPWVVFLIGFWGITNNQIQKQDMKYGMNLKFF